MNKNYSQEEINEILLSKPLDEFYFATLENKKCSLTDGELLKIASSSEMICCDELDEYQKQELCDKLLMVRRKNKVAAQLVRMMLGKFVTFRKITLITMIDNNIYDINNQQFLNLHREMIINYENVSNYFNESNATLRIVKPSELPKLKQDTVLLDYCSETDFFVEYKSKHINQLSNEDLTGNFIDECNRKKLIKK